MRVLVASASKRGATHEVARAIADGLGRHGLDVVRRPAEDVYDLAGIDAVVLGSGVHAGRWLPPARTLVTRLSAELNRLPVWLFTFGPPGGGEPEPSDLWFGGRSIVRLLHLPQDDVRNQAAIDAFVASIARALAAKAA